MTNYRPCFHDTSTNVPEVGMARFLTSQNLNRYRALANDAIGVTERGHILEDLASEMNAFKQECQMIANQRQR